MSCSRSLVRSLVRSAPTGPSTSALASFHVPRCQLALAEGGSAHICERRALPMRNAVRVARVDVPRCCSSHCLTAGYSASEGTGFFLTGHTQASRIMWALFATGILGLVAPPPRSVVVGAGPAGLATAIALAKRGWPDVQVFDRLPPPPALDDDSSWSDTARFYLIGIGGK